MYLFYRRYREISVLDNVKGLMHTIIRTRKTVKHYIIYSLSMVLVMVAIMVMGIYLNDHLGESFSGLMGNAEEIDPKKLKVTLMVGVTVMGILLTLAMGAIYFLLYGLLLRKLKKNYRELKQLEL